MATLTGQQALDYIKGGGKYTVNSGNVPTGVAPVSQEPTGLAGLISGLTSPFRGLASQGAQLGGGILDIINQMGKGGNLQNALANTNINNRPNPIGLLTQQETQRAQTSPLAFGYGNAAQIGSMAMPIGTESLGSALLGGAKMGAVGGGGQALSAGTDIGTGALTGGLLGGALGGVGYGAGKIANGLRTEPITVKSPIAEPTPIENLDTAAMDKSLNQNLDNVLAGKPIQKTIPQEIVETPKPQNMGKFSELGKKIETASERFDTKAVGLKQPELLKGSSQKNAMSDLIYKNINELPTANKGFAANFENLVDKAEAMRETALPNIEYSGNSRDLISKLAKDATIADGKMPMSKAKAMINDRIEQIFSEKPGSATRELTPTGVNYKLDAAALHDLSLETQGKAMAHYTRTSPQVAGTARPEEAIDFAINNYAKDILKKNPMYKEANDLYAALYNTLDKRTALANANNDLRLTYQGSPAFGQGILSKAEQVIAQGGRKIGQTLQGVNPAVPSAIGNTAVKGLGFLGNTTTQRLATYGAVHQATAPQKMPSIGVTIGSGSSVSMKTPQSSEQDFFAKLPFYTAIGMTPKEAYTQYMKENPTATTKTTKDMASAQSGLSALDKMSTLLGSDSTLRTQANLLPGVLQGSGAKQFTRAATEIRDVIARLRTGATINKEEQALYESYIPNMWDDQDTVDYKMGLLGDLFNTIASGGTQQQTSDLSLLQ